MMIAKTLGAKADSARRVLSNLEEIRAGDIAKSIARRRRVPLLAMLSFDRLDAFAAARRELWAVLYDSIPNMSYPWLARIVERDYSTVIHGVKLRREECLRELVEGGYAA